MITYPPLRIAWPDADLADRRVSGRGRPGHRRAARQLLGRTTNHRFFGPVHYLSTRDYGRALREVTGRRLPAVFLSATAMLPVGLLTGLVQRVWPWHIPAECV